MKTTHKQVHTFEDTLLTIKDLQSIFNCGKRQTYELLHVPGFPAMKPERKDLIRAKALDSRIQKRGKGNYQIK